MDPDLQNILQAAIQAPSGENVQPWRFKTANEGIELHHADVDSEIYDTGHRGSFVSHGAAIENMVIQAGSLGYETDVILFPNVSDRTHVATIHLNKVGGPSNNLSEQIPRRLTNRNPYETRPLDPQAVSALEEVTHSAQVDYKRVTDSAYILKLARIGSINEEIMLQNYQLHQFFFGHVSWTKEEDEQKKVGFYIKTLGLPTLVQMLFRLFRHWSVMSFLKTVGFPALIGKGNTQTYSSAAELGFLCIDKDTPENFIEIGRTLQRIWLTATSFDVSLQPLSGSLFMSYYLSQNETSKEVFSSHEQSLIKEAISLAQSVAGEGKIAAFAFRIGYGKPPEARASRFPLEHFLI